MQGVEDFARSRAVVAVIAEVPGENNRVGENRRLVAPSRTMCSEEVAIDPRFDGMHARHHRHARRMTSRSGAMGVGESDGLFGEAIEVGRDDPRVLGER